MSEESRLAMSTWIGALAASGVVRGEVHRAGVALATYVVGESRLSELRDWLHRQPPSVVTREKRAAIEVCIWMANADRRLDPEEAHFLRQIVGESGLDADTVDALVDAIHNMPSLEDLETRLTHPVMRELMLALAWELASADGHVDRLEEAFHIGLAKRLKVDPKTAEGLRDAIMQRLSLPPG